MGNVSDFCLYYDHHAVITGLKWHKLVPAAVSLTQMLEMKLLSFQIQISRTSTSSTSQIQSKTASNAIIQRKSLRKILNGIKQSLKTEEKSVLSKLRKTRCIKSLKELFDGNMLYILLAFYMIVR